MWWLFCGLLFAQEPNDIEVGEYIVVEAHRDIEVYVAPIEVIISTNIENIEAEVDNSSAFSYSSMYCSRVAVRLTEFAMDSKLTHSYNMSRAHPKCRSADPGRHGRMVGPASAEPRASRWRHSAGQRRA